MLRHTAAQCLNHRIGHFAVDVQLNLRCRTVAYTHRQRVLIATQPGQLVLLQTSLAAYAVHDLDLLRITGNRAQQPVPPGLGFLEVTQIHECQKGHGGVTQPAIAIIPIALAAQLLGQ